MASEWAETTLGNFLTLQRGFDLPAKDRHGGPYPVVASTGVVGSHSKAMVKGPGVVIGRSGSIGGGQFIRDDFWPLNTTLWVRDFKGNDERYCYYLLKSLDLANFNAGSGVPTLNRNHIHPMAIAVPKDVVEQRAIASVLGALDDKIELNRRLSETLEAMAQALFKSWFVDFRPVRAKAEGRGPGIPCAIAELFPDGVVDSPIDEIPERWGVEAIEDLAEIVGGSTPSTKEPAYWDGGCHLFATPRDLAGLSAPVLLDTEKRVTNAGLARISSGLLPKGTVLMSSRAPIGYLAVTSVPVAINQGFIAMKPRDGVPSEYLLLWARESQDVILSRANGSTFLEISKRNFRPIQVLAPPPPVLDRFKHVVRPIFDRIVVSQKQTRVLACLRDALLPKLTTGELRVGEAERLTEGAA